MKHSEASASPGRRAADRRRRSRDGRVRSTATRAALALCAVPLLLLAGCANDPPGHGSLERARERGLRAGFAIEPPYAYVDSLGEPTGEAPAILRRVAAELGIEQLQWFPLPFQGLIPALRAGRIDVVASGLFMTPERAREVRFSRPTACVVPALVVRQAAGEAEACAPCRIAVIAGSVEQRALDRHGHDTLVAVPDAATATQAVAAGSADGFAISAPTARALVQRRPDLELDPDGLPQGVREEARGCAALALRPSDTALAEGVDSVLAGFVGSPAHLELVAPFGFTAEELPCTADARPEGWACARAREDG